MTFNEGYVATYTAKPGYLINGGGKIFHRTCTNNTWLPPVNIITAISELTAFHGQTTVYTTQQGVQGIYCAVSAVLALRLWVLLMYCRWNLSSYGFLGYNDVCFTLPRHIYLYHHPNIAHTKNTPICVNYTSLICTNYFYDISFTGGNNCSSPITYVADSSEVVWESPKCPGWEKVSVYTIRIST